MKKILRFPVASISMFIFALFAFSNILVSAEERTVIAKSDYQNTSWTIYSDGEMVIEGSGDAYLNSSATDNAHLVTRVTVGEGIKSIKNRPGNVGYTLYGFNNIESISVEEENDYLKVVNDALLSKDGKTLYKYSTSCGTKEYIIPETVESLGAYAFYGSKNLKSVVFSQKIKSVPYYGFAECSLLEEIILKDELKSIGASSFENCQNLKNIDVSNVISIEKNAFKGCGSLTTVSLSESLTTLQEGAFADCTSLSSDIIIPESLTTFEKSVFAGCEAITNVIYKSDLDIPEEGFAACTSLAKFYIAGEISGISKNAFLDCGSLNEINFPGSVSFIDDGAFKNCLSLNMVSLPGNLERLNKTAFSNSGFYMNKNNWENGILYSGEYLLCADPIETDTDCEIKKGTRLIADYAFSKSKILSKVILPEGVKVIGYGAFSSCEQLREVTLPDSLVIIGENAFYNCSKLKRIEIPDNVTEIKQYTFYKCSGLTSVVLGNSVEKILNSAFSNCAALSSVTLNEGLKYIERFAFDMCSSLTEFEIPDSVTEIESRAFNNSGLYNGDNWTDGVLYIDNCLIYAKSGSVGTRHDVKPGTRLIASMAFYDCADVHELSIPSSVKAIGGSVCNSYVHGRIQTIYYDGSKNDWRNITIVKDNLNLNGILVADFYYNLKALDGEVNVIYNEDNIELYSGEIRLDAESLTAEAGEKKPGGFYYKEKANLIGLYNICLKDENGIVQPYLDKMVTVKIKAPENISTTMKIYHWYSDKTSDKEYQTFYYGDTIDATHYIIEDGYIVFMVNHFSEFAVCTDGIYFETDTVDIINQATTTLNYTVNDGYIVTFASSDESIATVDENGVVTAGKPGEATITATLDGTDITAKCKVNVLAREFTLTWNVDGNKTASKVYEGAEIAKPKDPVKEGYIFKKWSPDVSAYMPSNDVEYIAIFEKIKVTSVKIKEKPTKLNYTYKIDTLDLSGLTLEVTYSDGTKEIIDDLSDVEFSGFDNKKVGAQTVTAEYEGEKAEFEVTVSYVWWQWIIMILLLGFLWY